MRNRRVGWRSAIAWGALAVVTYSAPALAALTVTTIGLKLYVAWTPVGLPWVGALFLEKKQ